MHCQDKTLDQILYFDIVGEYICALWALVIGQSLCGWKYSIVGIINIVLLHECRIWPIIIFVIVNISTLWGCTICQDQIICHKYYFNFVGINVHSGYHSNSQLLGGLCIPLWGSPMHCQPTIIDQKLYFNIVGAIFVHCGHLIIGQSLCGLTYCLVGIIHIWYRSTGSYP